MSSHPRAYAAQSLIRVFRDHQRVVERADEDSIDRIASAATILVGVLSLLLEYLGDEGNSLPTLEEIQSLRREPVED